jgi:hypothetical protein
MQEKDKANIPNVEEQGWQSEEIIEEGAYQQADETTREILRGDETKGDPDQRDIAGGADYNETPHGRAETKHQTGGDETDG